jgi:tetratricopeptide (TPR) repeat protein
VRQLGRKESAPRVRRHTSDIEAYNLYLKGRFHWNKRTRGELRTAIGYFEQAIARDPAYAIAYAGLADCHNVLGFYGAEAPAATFPKAKLNAVKAIELDDTLAEAHTSLAFATLLYDWDWSSAEQAFLRALALNPDYSTAHHWYAEYLTFVGRVEEAMEVARNILSLDPLSPIIHTLVGWVHFYARDYDRAIEVLEGTLALDRDFVPALLWLGLSQERKGSFERAAATLQRAVDLEGEGPTVSSGLGRVLAVSGDGAGARVQLERLLERAARTYVPAYHIAALHAALGRTEEMLRCLEEALRQRDLWLLFLRIDPVWDSVREDAGFAEIVRRVGLP